MAKKNDENIELVKVKALACLKYNKEYMAIGQEFEVNKNDLEEMVKRGLIETGSATLVNDTLKDGLNEPGEVIDTKEGE